MEVKEKSVVRGTNDKSLRMHAWAEGGVGGD